jgi:xylulose-5-phosphate/fructose-6-phosphate phosphoketolase
VRGYKEEGTTTTPFDMCVLNEIDRYSLAIDAIDRVPKLMSSAAHVRQELVDKIIEHKHYPPPRRGHARNRRLGVADVCR